MALTIPKIILILAFCIFQQNNPPKSEFSFGTKGKVEVFFTSAMTIDDLENVKTDLAKEGISLSYQELIFDNEGKLTAIDFKVDTNDGYNGTARTKSLPSGKTFGFYRDYSEDAAIPFAIGNIK